MKKILSLLLAFVLVFSLVACGEKKDPAGDSKETKAEEAKETKAEENKDAKETKAEEAKDNKESAPAERKVSANDGKIAKIGLGSSVQLQAKELKDDKGQATSNVAITGLAFDADGKIVRAYIDVAQSKFDVKDDGTFAIKPDEAEFKTKLELGDEYGMKAVSAKAGIGKEWFEQAKAFEEYILGKTAEEVASIKTKKKDDKHLAVPDEADLVSSVTIDIDAFQKSVANAWENAVEVKDAEKLGLSVTTALGHKTAEAKDDKGAAVQFETTAGLVATDKDGKVVKAILDTAQNAVEFEKDGKVKTDLAKAGTTKKALGAEYGMKEKSPIKKEWDEQIKGLEDFVVGKTSDEISALELEKGKAKDADLLSTTTITIDEFKQNLVNAVKSVQ